MIQFFKPQSTGKQHLSIRDIAVIAVSISHLLQISSKVLHPLKALKSNTPGTGICSSELAILICRPASNTNVTRMEENSAQHKEHFQPFVGSSHPLHNTGALRLVIQVKPVRPNSKWNVSRSVCKRIWSWEHPHQALNAWVAFPQAPVWLRDFPAPSSQVPFVLPAHPLAPFPPGAEGVSSENTPGGRSSEWEHWHGHIHRPPKITVPTQAGDRTAASNCTSKSLWRNYQHRVLTNRLQTLCLWGTHSDSVTLPKMEDQALGHIDLKMLPARKLGCSECINIPQL